MTQEWNEQITENDLQSPTDDFTDESEAPEEFSRGITALLGNTGEGPGVNGEGPGD